MLQRSHDASETTGGGGGKRLCVSLERERALTELVAQAVASFRDKDDMSFAPISSLCHSDLNHHQRLMCYIAYEEDPSFLSPCISFSVLLGVIGTNQAPARGRGRVEKGCVFTKCVSRWMYQKKVKDYRGSSAPLLKIKVTFACVTNRDGLEEMDRGGVVLLLDDHGWTLQEIAKKSSGLSW